MSYPFLRLFWPKCNFFQSPLSPGKLQEVEQENLDKISTLSNSLLEKKKRLSQLEKEKETMLHEKFSRLKNLRQEENNSKATDMDDKERELCRRTNQVVSEFVQSCDETRFNKTLINVLGNLKGK